MFTSRGDLRVGLDPEDPTSLARPSTADAHRRELLAQLPSELAQVLEEPLGPLGLAGATSAVPLERRLRDGRTAAALREFAARRLDPLPEWDFGR
jgi:hypothetical protein